MKKPLLLLVVFFSISSFAGDTIRMVFKNGEIVDYLALSYWTEWNWKHDYKIYFKNAWDLFRVANYDYLCFYDYSCMNPASRELKRGDYKNLRDAIQSTGNEANYAEENGVLIDDWCVSVRYDQLSAVVSNGSNVYVNGEKK